MILLQTLLGVTIFVNGVEASTCSMDIIDSDVQDEFGSKDEYFKIKITSSAEGARPNMITFSDIVASPELGNVIIERKTVGGLINNGDGTFQGRANEVMKFRFKSDVKDLKSLPAGTYHASVTVFLECGYKDKWQ